MVFASFIFVFWFLPVFLAAYQATPMRFRNIVLTVGSFVFYGWWRPHYVVLMLLSIFIDYVAALLMGEPSSGKRRKTWLVASVTSNLVLLGWFKYANLFVGTWNDVTPWPVEWEKVLLPVGISFFTFQSMSYTIDVYRGDVKATRSFADLLCFVSMFPQLVAGPIVRYRDVQEQILHRSRDLLRVSDGVHLIAIGLAKKVLIADSVAHLVAAVWQQDAPGLAGAWIGGVAYAIQIYFDFSGYSDMAIGLGLLLGFRFPSNFLSPYQARSMTELWRRWHVSLSTWLRDYLYRPLGGNRLGEGRAQVNVMITMLLGGLWHGAAWNYLLWGAWHGVFLVMERRLGKGSPYAWLPRPMQVLCTFAIWTIGIVIFHCETAAELHQTAGGLFGVGGAGAIPSIGSHAPFAWSALAVGLCLVFFVPRSEELVRRFHPLVMLASLAAGFLAVCQLASGGYVPFIYYQF